MTPSQARARIDRYGGRLNAFTTVFDPAAGEGPTFAVKDMIDFAGVPTGGGGRSPLDPSPARHAVAVERLLEAGWAAVGKTQTVELAYGGWGTNRAVGEPWNPWDAQVHRAPGGSSSGSAVAVAAGLCDVALGTDTGGSVRIPAGVCGVVGLKPGRGLVSLRGVHDLAPSLDTVGTLARSVAEAARALAIISGPDGDDAGRGVFDAETALARDPRGWRVAALAPEAIDDMEAQIARLYGLALDALRKAGVEIETAMPPRPLSAYFEPNGVLMAAEGWRVRGAHIEANADQMDPWIVSRFRMGRGITDVQLVAARARRVEDQAEFHAWLAGYSALVCPTCPIEAPPIAGVDETISPLSSLTRAGNYLDLPAATVPCGLTAGGLPAGLQIMGGPADEASVVTLAAAFERASGWNSQAPDLTAFAV
ncbi:MAG: amidase [Pseudomonadota bacterium]|uniref:amidase n=1 Tax=Phenylobacterium sp. TaxID=1871053 RepID=UPI0025E025B4|nr:amidase [Phenylobacterium sp.]MBT9472155.1 amidase [Phenylobacterium sp.]